MINDDKFVISFTEFLPDSLGTLGHEAKRADNHYKDGGHRETYCCGCEK